MFLYKIPDERLLQQRLLIEIKLCSVIVCCTLYHNFWSPLWRMFNTSGDSLLLYHTNHNTSVICTHRLGNRYLVKLKLFCTVNTPTDVKMSVQVLMYPWRSKLLLTKTTMYDTFRFGVVQQVAFKKCWMSTLAKLLK